MKQASRSRHHGWLTMVVAGFTLLLTVLWSAPLLWALSTALRPEVQTVQGLQWLPHPVVLTNFLHVATAGGLPRWFLNSIISSLLVTLVTIVLSVLAAYAFSQVTFPGARVAFWLMMAAFVFPFEALIIPLFREIHAFGLTDTLAGIVLPQIVSPMTVYVLRQFFDQIPRDFREAALLDGASEWSVMRRIYLPLSSNIIYAMGIVVFIGAWNNFMWPFIVITSPSKMTVPVGLTQITDAYGVHYAQMMASALLGGFPVALAYLVFQRRVSQGFLAATGLKG